MLGHASYVSIGGRDYSEDSVRVRESVEPHALVAVLADGLGGHGGGDVASAIVAEGVSGAWTPDATPESLAASLEAAHTRVREAQTADIQMKSTAVALSVVDGASHAAYAYAGDSRIYHFAEGGVRWQSRDHSASQIAVMLGQITPAQIRHHEDRSRLYKALGQEGELAPDSGTLELAPGLNAFLLCSDGLWEYVDEEAMERELVAAADAEGWLAALRAIHDATAPADCDNNSAIAVWLTR